MKKVVLLMALVASMSMHAQIIGTTEDGQAVEIGHEKPIGPLHYVIAESFPDAKQVIEQIPPERGMKQFKIALQTTIYNTSDHELRFVSPGTDYIVIDMRTGLPPKDTPAGCYINGFSKCFTPSVPVGIPSSGLPVDVIPVGGKVTHLEYLDQGYILEAGKYSVTGIYCTAKGQGRECFKSNTITITIPPATK
jgi:hypothetical protein